jgi:hypothetical protein
MEFQKQSSTSRVRLIMGMSIRSLVGLVIIQGCVGFKDVPGMNLSSQNCPISGPHLGSKYNRALAFEMDCCD